MAGTLRSVTKQSGLFSFFTGAKISSTFEHSSKIDGFIELFYPHFESIKCCYIQSLSFSFLHKAMNGKKNLSQI